MCGQQPSNENHERFGRLLVFPSIGQMTMAWDKEERDIMHQGSPEQTTHRVLGRMRTWQCKIAMELSEALRAGS